MLSNRSKPRFIIFDYGETLAHEDGFHPDLGFAALLKHAVKNPQDMNGDTLLDAFAACFKQLRLEAHAIGVEIPNRQRWKWLFETYDLEFSLPEEELETTFWNAAAPCVPTPGMVKLLSILRGQGIGTGVVSNMGFTGTALKRRLDDLFPEHSFRFVMSSADYVLRKPNPRLFDLAVKKSGCRAEETWFAGDNPAMDIVGAANAGLTPIYYDRDLGCAYRETPHADNMPPCIRIEDWSELYDFLNA